MGLEIGEHIRVILSASVAAEWCWTVADDQGRWDQHITSALQRARRHGDTTAAEEITFWQILRGDRVPDAPPTDAIERQLAGDLSTAAAVWQAQGGSFQALVLGALGGGGTAIQDTFEVLGDLHADGTLAALRRDLRQRGVEGLPRGPSRSTRQNPAGLTNRQLDVLRALATGMSNGEIADALYISPKTVEHHVSAVLTKLAARSRSEAIAVARSNGWLDRADAG
jgi:DNA-binding CsgD family transcriptional regulator